MYSKKEEYFANPSLSQSELKAAPYGYAEEVDEEVGKRHFIVGDAFDKLFTEDISIENEYTKCTNMPSVKALNICNILLREYPEALANDYDEENSEEQNRLIVLLESMPYKNKATRLSLRLANFIEECTEYIALRVMTGKIVLSLDEWKELRHMETLIQHKFMAHTEPEGITYWQEPIYWLEQVNNVTIPCKGLPDKFIVNHSTRQVFPFDCKTTRGSPLSFKSSFEKYEYDVQAAWYSRGLQALYKDYTIEPFRFIVFSKNTKYKYPAVFQYNPDCSKIDALLLCYLQRKELSDKHTPLALLESNGLLLLE